MISIGISDDDKVIIITGTGTEEVTISSVFDPDTALLIAEMIVRVAERLKSANIERSNYHD